MLRSLRRVALQCPHSALCASHQLVEVVFPFSFNSFSPDLLKTRNQFPSCLNIFEIPHHYNQPLPIQERWTLIVHRSILSGLPTFYSKTLYLCPARKLDIGVLRQVWNSSRNEKCSSVKSRCFITQWLANRSLWLIKVPLNIMVHCSIYVQRIDFPFSKYIFTKS